MTSRFHNKVTCPFMTDLNAPTFDFENFAFRRYLQFYIFVNQMIPRPILYLWFGLVSQMIRTAHSPVLVGFFRLHVGVNCRIIMLDLSFHPKTSS